MKHIIAAIILLTSLAASAGNLVEKADSAYAGQRFTEAIELYSAAIDSLGASADTYYNLGNSYYRANNPGMAVVSYNRALRLDPTHKDARANLDFVTSKLPDHPGDKGTFIGNSVDAAATSLTTDAWAWIALLCFILAASAVMVYIFTGNVMWRKAGFFGGGALSVLTILALALSIRGAAIARSHNEAVVTASSAILSSSPRQPASNAEEVMMLHEGATLRIIDSVSVETDSVKQTWLDVEVDNQHRAWINAADVEII